MLAFLKTKLLGEPGYQPMLTPGWALTHETLSSSSKRRSGTRIRWVTGAGSLNNCYPSDFNQPLLSVSGNPNRAGFCKISRT